MNFECRFPVLLNIYLYPLGNVVTASSDGSGETE